MKKRFRLSILWKTEDMINFIYQYYIDIKLIIHDEKQQNHWSLLLNIWIKSIFSISILHVVIPFFIDIMKINF